MKLNAGEAQIVIGKRVVVGQMVGAVISIAAYMWDVTHPNGLLPAFVVTQATALITGVIQVYIANNHSITTKE